jgi:predicted dienelactone hydrolase
MVAIGYGADIHSTSKMPMWFQNIHYPRKRTAKPGKNWPKALILGLGLTILSALPVEAAEKIYFEYGPLVRAVNISSLETLAESGKVEDDLAFYIDLIGLNKEEVAQLREVLQQQAEVDGVLLSRFLYTDIGEALLAQIGQIIRTRAGNSGTKSLRAALILAATSPEGLTPLNALRQLPTDLQIDVADVLAVEATINQIIEATQTSVARLAELSAQEARFEPEVDYSALPDLTQPGRYGSQRQRWRLKDPSRDRELYVDIIRPRQWPQGQVPVIVVSHGLAASPETWRDQADHLASHGFLVALPQHPGSDIAQFNDFRQGLSNQIFDLQEFINRPLDISFVLDELERRNQSDFGNRLKLSNVGVAGHSFGGYTALAVAGARLNFPYLQTVCEEPQGYLNISLLLQCRALQLPQQEYDFRDPRVGSIVISNPVNSSLFGPEGLAAIDIPVMVMAGSYDPATPAVYEQFLTFPWYGDNGQSHYLALLEGQAHVDLSELDAGVAELVRSIPDVTLAPSELIGRYIDALSLAFFQRYTAGWVDYRAYLRPTYAAYLSEGQEFKLYMVSDQMADAVAEFIESELNLPEAIEQP